MAKLKVYVTPIGFHDAYVAAPSQTAALRAWGASANLFTRGVAELVTDPKLTEAPLAAPGEVIKVARGTAAEHIAALPKTKKAASAKPTASAKATQKPVPRPSRDALRKAEAALADLTAEQEKELAALERRERELAQERQQLENAQAAARAKLEQARDKAASAYDAALEKWRG